MNALLTISMLLLLSLPVWSQHNHSGHGVATPAAAHCRPTQIRQVALPPPTLMEGIGKSHLTITTRSDSAQRYFDQGLSLLHDFWDFEAYRAFSFAAQLDSSCAMAQWGIVLAIPDGDTKRQGERKKALERAIVLSKNASEHEQLYINALAAGGQALEAKKSRQEAGRVFLSEMEHLIHRYPEDVEAKLIMWNNTMGGQYSADGKPKENTLYGQTLLEKLLVSHSDHHAVHHYWIHQMENCCPQQALASAEKLSSLAPASGHIVHMPGHIYYRVGDYKRARQSFLAAMRIDSAYMAQQDIHRLDTWNYDHNLAYLIANDAEEGRYQEAMRILERLVDPSGMQDTARAQQFKQWAFSNAAYTPVTVAVRFGNFDQAANYLLRALADTAGQHRSMGDKAYADYRTKPVHRVWLAYLLGMDAVEKGKLELARQYANELDADLWRRVKQDKDADEWKEKTENLFSLELQGSLFSLQGDATKAFRLLKEAVKLEKELGYGEPPPYHHATSLTLGQAYLRAKQWQKARTTYTNFLIDRPNNGMALYGLAQAWEGEGKDLEATKAYQTFLTAWNEADADLPQLKKAKAWMRTNKRLVGMGK